MVFQEEQQVVKEPQVTAPEFGVNLFPFDRGKGEAKAGRHG